jgi:hypothetical protein
LFPRAIISKRQKQLFLLIVVQGSAPSGCSREVKPMTYLLR